ncbi:MAG: glycosyltransferase [Chitinivibrionales bacterium]|nr:glycosyltransferase [Chitinivibrionales bacterium]MBD3394619.1 glycosyltransferase [Chitinivibrionales bacterium]
MLGCVIACTLYVLCSLLLLCYGLQCYVLTFLYLRARKQRVAFQQKRMKFFEGIGDESVYPKVVTQLPMYNEKTVAVRIIEAVAAMDYPRSKHEIQVLDDSTDETRQYVDDTVARLREQGVRIATVRRDDRVGFKAGALQNGLARTDAEYVAIFDADFVPYPDFLKKAIPFFVDRPNLGLVQGRWTHLNRHASLITRGQAIGIDGHFMVEQAARSWNKLFMNFNGTAGVFRRSAIEACGGWQHDTLTEDMDLSYRMQLADWETEYVPDLEVPAEIPEDINAFKNQQFRWAKGSIQTAIKIIPLLVKRRMPVFKFVQAVLHLTHYTVHPLMLMMAILTMPVLHYVKVTLPPWAFVTVVFAMILATSGPSTMYLISQHFIGNKKRKMLMFVPMMMLIGTGLAVNNAKAVLEALLRKHSPFHRTPKKGQKAAASYRPIKDITCVVEILLGLYCMASFSMFFGYTNFVVSPFLILYASGFLFVGSVSIAHFKRPELIDLKLDMLRAPRPAA